MSENKKYLVRLNYLGCLLSDEVLHHFQQDNLSRASFRAEKDYLEAFFEIDPYFLNRNVFDRYSAVVGADTYIPITPTEPELQGKLFGLIRSARRCYCFGEYLGAVELSAMYCEMLACFILKHADAHPENVDTVPQPKRIKNLKKKSLVTDGQEEEMLYVHKTRKEYFHWWTTSTDYVQSDACKCVNKIAKLTKELLLEMKDGHDGLKLWVSDSIRKFFESEA